jgi:hypothetical protein
MFGFFEKKAIDNNQFNNLVIAALGEVVGNLGRIPTENEFYACLNNLFESKNVNISQSQFNSVKMCGISLQMGFGDEVLPLIKQLNAEIPRGERISHDKILKLMCGRAILVSDSALDLFNKYK